MSPDEFDWTQEFQAMLLWFKEDVLFLGLTCTSSPFLALGQPTIGPRLESLELGKSSGSSF